MPGDRAIYFPLLGGGGYMLILPSLEAWTLKIAVCVSYLQPLRSGDLGLAP